MTQSTEQERAEFGAWAEEYGLSAEPLTTTSIPAQIVGRHGKQPAACRWCRRVGRLRHLSQQTNKLRGSNEYR